MYDTSAYNLHKLLAGAILHVYDISTVLTNWPDQAYKGHPHIAFITGVLNLFAWIHTWVIDKYFMNDGKLSSPLEKTEDFLDKYCLPLAMWPK